MVSGLLRDSVDERSRSDELDGDDDDDDADKDPSVEEEPESLLLPAISVFNM